MQLFRTCKWYIASVALMLALFCVCSWQIFVNALGPVSMLADSEYIESAQTSSSYRYTTAFQKTLSNPRYTRFMAMYNADFSTAIPGLASTDILGRNIDSMVPQGICLAEDYMLISAYDAGSKHRHSKCKSVIYVLSNKNPKKRQYLTTIVLPDVNHVGGLAYDGRNVWVAKSTTRTCSAIDIRVIDQAVRSDQNSFALNEYTKTVDCGMNASFVTYHDHKLWVGSFVARKNGVGELRSFDISGRGDKLQLTKSDALAIPNCANGAMFLTYRGKTCLAVASSYSRYSDSKVNIYEVYKGHDDTTRKRLCETFTMPPMAEELVSDGKQVYALFESGATEYSGIKYDRCVNLVDRVCAFAVEDFFVATEEKVTFTNTRKTSPERVESKIVCDATCPEDDDFTKFIENEQFKSSLIRKAALLDIYKYPDFSFANYYKLLRPWIPSERSG